MLLTILVFLVILTILVLIHELGHFLVAKKFGIKVEEFGFGLPPRLLGIKKGETIYSINWLPIGGFVKLYGEDDPKVALLKKGQAAARSFYHHSIGERAAVVVSGVLMNFLLASLLFYVTLSATRFTFELPLIFDHSFRFVRQEALSTIVIESVSPSSPAETSGIRPRSKVVSLNGRPFEEGSLAFKQYIDAHRGQSVVFALEDLTTGQVYEVSVVPRLNPPEGEGALGIAFTQVRTARLSYETVPMRVFSGVIHAANLAEYNLKILGGLIGIAIERRILEPVSEGVTGPIGIGSIVNAILAIKDLKMRVVTLLNMTALISISLSIINIVPFPALDGGRLFLIAIETVTRRRIDPTVERHINTIGFIILLMLMLLISYRDFLRFVLVQ